jgi:hypothetical protein
LRHWEFWLASLSRYSSNIRYTALVNEDPKATYSRDIQKWLLDAAIIGVLAGLTITGIAAEVLSVVWAALLPYYLAHNWAIVVGLVAGFFVITETWALRDPRTGASRLARSDGH